MSDRVFVDTNIFVYAKLITAKEQEKNQMAKHFLQTQPENVVVSTQVLSEFASVLIKHRVSDNNIQLAVEAIAESSLVSAVSWHTVQAALRIKFRYQFSYRDSLIIASALENNCTVLFTEDLQHDQLIEEKLISDMSLQEQLEFLWKHPRAMLVRQVES